MIDLDLDLYPSGTSICSLCRELVDEGVPLDTIVDFKRNGVSVFATKKPLKHWAKLRVAESSGDHFPRLVPYQLDVNVPQTQEKEFTYVEA